MYMLLLTFSKITTWLPCQISNICVYWDQLDANCLVLFYYTFSLYMFRM